MLGRAYGRARDGIGSAPGDLTTVISMNTPSGTFDTRAGIVDVNEYGNDGAWDNLSFSPTTSTGSVRVVPGEVVEQHSLSTEMRAIATDYHDSMAAAA